MWRGQSENPKKGKKKWHTCWCPNQQAEPLLTEEDREAGRSLIKTDPGQEQIFAEHLDGLERSDFCDFDKLRKRTCQKAKIESNEQSKEGGRPK